MRIQFQMDRQYRHVVLATAVLSMAAVGVLDWAVGPKISLGTLYLIPVVLSSWVGNRRQRLATCFLAGAGWCAGELWWDGRNVGFWVVIGNAIVRLGVYLVVAELTAAAAGRHATLSKEVLQRTRAEYELKRLNETLEEKVVERTAAAEKRSRELAQSEAALRHQAEVLQSILNSMGDGVVVANAEGKIVLINPQGEHLLQVRGRSVTLREWLGQHRTYLPEALAAEWNSVEHPLLRALRGGTVEGAEMLIVHDEGDRPVWVRTSATPLVNEQGQVRGGVILFSDVTARKQLEKQVAEISDREQRRIGYDLHDGVCQHLVSTAFACDMLAESLAERGAPEGVQAAQIGQSIHQAIIQARNLARALYPIDLTGDGLHSALEELAEKVRESTRICCRFHGQPSAKISDQGIGINLYRIAQEAANNAVKHSGASQITLSLAVREGAICLCIEDDGCSLLPRVGNRKGMGLDIMNYRARSIGAVLEMEPRLEGGTRIACHLPASSRSKLLEPAA
jgi:PAS domain S-box-containing protein